MLPNVYASNNYTTYGGQHTQTYETARKNYNLWVLGGLQVDGGGAAVQSGGMPTPYIAGYFDEASSIEVNSSGVLTNNGGYWPVPAPLFTGQIATGTPTTTSLVVSGTPYINQSMVGYVVIMTSGAANGQTAVIHINNTNTLTLYADGTASPTAIGTFAGLTIAPSAGDTFNIIPVSTLDGVHPNVLSHVSIGSSFATWINSNLTPQ